MPTSIPHYGHLQAVFPCDASIKRDEMLRLRSLLYLIRFNWTRYSQIHTKWMCETRSRLIVELIWTYYLANGSPKHYIGNRASTLRGRCRWWTVLRVTVVKLESGKTYYCLIPYSLEATRLDVIKIASLCNLTGISAALLPSCLSNFKAIRKVGIRI